MVQVNNFTGFETEGTEEAIVADTLSFLTSGQRSGGSCVRFISSGEFDLSWAEGVTDAGSGYIFGFGIQLVDTVGQAVGPVWVLDDSGGVILQIQKNTSEQLELRDAAGSILDTSAVLSIATWYYIEVYAELNSSSADWEWFIDGVSEGSGAAADLTDGNAFGSSSSIFRVGGSAGDTTYFDDVYILSGATSADDRLGTGTQVITYQGGNSGSAADFDNTGAAGGDSLGFFTNGWADAGETPLDVSAGHICRYDTNATQNGAIAFDDTNAGGGGPGPYADLTNLQFIKATKFHWHARFRDVSGPNTYERIYGKTTPGATTATVAKSSLPLTSTHADYFTLIENTDANCPNTSQYAVMGGGIIGSDLDDLEFGEMWAHTLVVNSNRQLNNFTGFETQGTEEASAVSGSLIFETTNQRSGDASVVMDSSGVSFDLPWVAENITDAGEEYIVGFGFRKTGNPSVGPLFFRVFDDTSSGIFYLTLDTNGDLLVKDQPTSVVRTIPDPFSDNTWYYIEVYLGGLNTASGTVEVFINGITQGSDSSVDLTAGNAFGSSSSSIRLQGLGSTDAWYDDVYILSGCNGPEDRLGDFEVFGHQNDEADGTPDYGSAGGTGDIDKATLDTGTWDDLQYTPLSTGEGQAIYSGGTQVGLVLYDDSANANGLNGGPNSASEDYYDGDANIKARKGIWNVERGSGSGTTHTLYLAQSTAAGTAATGVASRAVTLTTAAQDFELLDTTVPLSTEDIAQGFGKGAGGREFEANEMWVMIAHVPIPEAGVTYVNLDTSAIDAVASVTSSISMNWGINSTIAGSGDITSALNRRMIIDAAIATTTAVTPTLDAQPGLRSALASTTSITSELSVIKMLDAVAAATSSVAAALDAQSGLYSSIDATTDIASTLNNQRILDASIAALGDVVSSLSRGMVIDGTIATTTSVAVDLDAQPGLYSTIAALSAVTSELGNIKALSATIAASTSITSSLSADKKLASAISATGAILSSVSLTLSLTASIGATSSLTSALAATKSLDSSIAALAAITSSLSMNWGLDSNVAAAASLSSALDAQSGLYSSIAAVSDIVSELDIIVAGVTFVNLDGTIAGSAAITSSLSVLWALNSVIAATGDISSALAAAKTIGAVIAATGAVSSSLDPQSGLYSSISVSSAIAAALAADKSLDVDIAAITTLAAAVDAQPGLYATLAASSDILVSLNSIRSLDSLIAAVGSVDGQIGAVVNIDGTILGTSTVVGAASLLRSLDSLITGTSSVDAEMNKLVGFSVVIAGAVTIAGEIIGEAPDFRGFVFPANAEQYHLTSDNAGQYHLTSANAEQYHSTTDDAHQYHSLIKDISQSHLGVANEFN